MRIRTIEKRDKSMGAWGYKPFQNDWILNDIGGFQVGEDLVKDIKRCLNKETVYYQGYEFTALLVSTYLQGAKKQFIIDEDTIIKIMKTLDKDILTKEERDLFHESSKTWTSACSIQLSERKELLKKCANKLKEELDNPATGNEYFEKDKFILSMKHVYTTAMEIINNPNDKPAFISKERFKRLLNAYDNIVDTDFNNILLVCCIDKLYKGNKIVAYLIEDQHGRRNEVTPEQLKDAIRNKTIECTNLTLTSDNRLINTTGL